MNRFRFLFSTSLGTKVLVPVLACMAALIATTVLVVNEQVTRQFEHQARETLTTANAEFLELEKTRSEDLLLRFRNLPNEPRYRAAFQLGDAPTLHQPLAGLLGEEGADIVFYATGPGTILAGEQCDPAMAMPAFQQAAAPATTRALAGQATADTVFAGDRLYHVVSIPVYVERDLIGALTLGLEIGNAEPQKFSELTHGRIVLIAGGRVVASTLSRPEDNAKIAAIYGGSQAHSAARAESGLQQVFLNGEHYFGMTGHFDSLARDQTPGYVLLSSYEQPLRMLQQTRRLLLTASVCAIFIGAAIVWFVIRKATRPLRDLRDSVEAVGRGDLSRRVVFKSQDECGELAEVYNRMAENLKQSREQLEKAHAELVASSRLAGMAEIAAGVLHNVGNVLTSINIASSLLTENVKHSKTGNLGKVVSLMREHDANLGDFLTRDPKGVQAIKYLGALSDHLIKEQNALLQELTQIQEGTRHIEDIVRAQQSYSRVGGVVETLKVADVIHDALKMSVSGKTGIEIVEEIPDHLTVTVEKHKVLQILVNLLRNARQACDSSAADVKTLCIRAVISNGFIRVAVTDNGVGIDPQNMGRMFSHGFTTKKDGHGFGLHSSAAAARELGGDLRVDSEGLGKGATFTLEVPLKPAPATATENGKVVPGTKPQAPAA